MATATSGNSNVLLIGNGGREHALAWKLHQSPKVQIIHVAPGNGGTAQGLPKVSNQPQLKVGDFAGLVEFARDHAINLVVPGPEQPLVDGIVDFFKQNLPGVRVFGPSKAAAQLEASKAFAKDFMIRNNIPTAQYEKFVDIDKALGYIDKVDHRIVIKATGLAAGKGVILPDSKDEAREAVHRMMGNKEFGSAGEEIVIEERLDGQEISILSFCDGCSIKSLPPAQDHKQVNDGDKGPNTGGMGAYGPAPVATPHIIEEIHQRILQPTIDGMRREQRLFRGLLFTGFMITNDGPKVLEYNVRFGDPETQTLLPLLDGDLAEIMLACTRSYLDEINVQIRPEFATTVIAAAGGYPGSYGKGDPIVIDKGAGDDGLVFHAGTTMESGELKTSGGRVIATTCTAASIEDSVRQAYKLMDSIHFNNMHYRKDIAHRALLHARSGEHQSGSDKAMTYASAGVSIAAGNSLVDRIRPLVAATARSGSPAQIGGFGGSFNLAEAGYKESPTLVTGTDGVGTKLMIAHAMNKHDTIGIDLVAMNVNDIVVCGAEPLYLTDVYSCHKLDVSIAVEVVKGICDGCIQSGCALLGGETAEMGQMFQPGEYDVTATTTGAVPKGQKMLPDKASMEEGDILLGMASSGCHSNGFSLVRKILERNNLRFTDKAPWDSNSTVSVGDALLTATQIYVKPLLQVIRKDLVKGMAHITGGGLLENIPRMLPLHLAAELDASSWPVPPVLRWLKGAGNLTTDEFSRVFNTGLGMVLVISGKQADATRSILQEAGEDVYTVGRVISRKQKQDGCVILNAESWR